MNEGQLSIERRATPRLSVKIPVKYRLEDDQKVLKTIQEWRKKQNAYTLDVSLGGMNLVVDHPLAVGQILEFEVYLLDPVKVVSIYGEVRWANEKEAGLKFVMAKDEDLEALQAFLRKSTQP